MSGSENSRPSMKMKRVWFSKLKSITIPVLIGMRWIGHTRVITIGMPGGPIPYDVLAACVKEARVEHIFRYAHVYPRAVALMGSGKIDVKPLITGSFDFAAH